MCKEVKMSVGKDGLVRVECGEESVWGVLTAVMRAMKEAARRGEEARAVMEVQDCAGEEAAADVGAQEPEKEPVAVQEELPLGRTDRMVDVEWGAAKFGVSAGAMRRWLRGLKPRGKEGRRWQYSLLDVEAWLRGRTEEASSVAQEEWGAFDGEEGQMWVSLGEAVKYAGGVDYLEVHRVISDKRRRGKIRYCVPGGREFRGGTYYYLLEDVRRIFGRKGGEA